MRGPYTAWLSLTMLLCSTGVATSQEGPLDYPQWRGLHRDGAAAAFTEPDAWPSQLTQQWQVEIESIGEYFDTFGDRLPAALRQEQQRIAKELASL